ncbi:hypothetical protein GcC1_024032 [Golovinomyces cichoracearum]|uniref:Integrase and RNaseH domain-containing protein n=1 Tax=Golovinomyces cichoracearum TaxID=62708 RepID=A0A420J498_9PEZI|nr:hypothetical protein GcC1_024032 [Golovinomyces cichoracearum]
MPTSPISAKLQAQFVKIWRQTDNFTGDPYDLLDDKTRHFLSVCDSISVTPTQFANLFRLILNGKAQQLRTQIITYCRGVPELEQALFDPGSASQEILAKLRSAAKIYGDRTPTGFIQETEEYDQFIIDRRFNSNVFRCGGYNGRDTWHHKKINSSYNKGKFTPYYSNSQEWKRNIISEVRERARMQYFSGCKFFNDTPNYALFLAGYGGEQRLQHAIQMQDEEEE